MGWFRKESSTHFERDSSGRVTSVERSGDEPRSGLFNRESRTPASDKLLDQARDEKRQARADARERAREKNRVYREEYEKARHQSKIKRMRSEGRRAGSISPWDRLGGVPTMGGYSTRNNFNPFGSMFDTGLGYKKPYKSKTSGGKTKYKVIGGKAYPIAGSGKKKTTKKRKKSSSGLGGFDMFDNYGYMK